ncbi:hypothetical protein K438DRAFT_1969517 [Mycena galopus ATCC 62051]|nr:hypothetical protein K438DRAFT_1969517 [Mycena galopus ATCC 62051]
MSWARDTRFATVPSGWTQAEVDQILNYPAGHQPRDMPLGFERATDVCTRSPFIPSLQEFENIIIYEMSNWQAPELAPMRREHRSGIARAISLRKCKPPSRSTDKIVKYNPYLKAQCDAECNAQRDAYRNQQRAPPVRVTQYRVFNGAPRNDGIISTQNADVTMKGISSSTVSLRSVRQSRVTHPVVDVEIWARSRVTRAVVEPPERDIVP